jgi:serine protease Do
VRAVTESDAVVFKLSIPRGIVVINVEKGGLADAMQMEPGDVILEVNGTEIGDMQIFTQIIRSGAARTFRVWHNGQSVKSVVPESL